MNWQHIKQDSGRLLLYWAASGISAALDYGIYTLLLPHYQPWACYLPARAASAMLNYQLNRRGVFKTPPSAKSAVSYAALASLNALIGTSGVQLLTGQGVGSYIAKLALDVTLFIANFLIQKYFIFNRKKEN